MAQSHALSVKTVTASTTQTQAGGALAIGHGDINICTVANASDAVGISPNLPAGTVVYYKGGANAGVLYPPTGGTINAEAANAGIALAATVLVVCVVLTQTGSASTYAVYKTTAP